MASVLQGSRRRGSGKSVSSPEETSGMIQLPDLQHVAVFSRAEWLRIQDELNWVDKDQERQREAARQREALHLRSKEVVKLWSNTVNGQRQKRLQAKKLREQIEEEKRKASDAEELKYQEQKRKEAIERAKTQLFYQTAPVKGLHRALLLTEVLKEREAQAELKERMRSASREVDKELAEMAKTREDEAARREREKARQRKLERRAVAEALKSQIKEDQLTRARQKEEEDKDGEEIQRLRELYQWEQKVEEDTQAKQKRQLMQAHQEHVSNRQIIQAKEAQEQEAEEGRRKLFLAAKQKMMKLRKDRERELFQEAQTRREKIMEKLTVTQRQTTESEGQRIAKAVAEQDAREAERQRSAAERRAAALRSIAAHRERTRQEREQRDKVSQQETRDSLQAKREVDRVFLEEQQQKARSAREEAKRLQDFNAALTLEKSGRDHQLKREEQAFQERNAELGAEEEGQFRQYSLSVIGAAAEAQRNVFPLCRAAREAAAAGQGLGLGGARPCYLVQDGTGAELPKYTSDATQRVKTINEVADIQEAKRRLGFTW